MSPEFKAQKELLRHFRYYRTLFANRVRRNKPYINDPWQVEMDKMNQILAAHWQKEVDKAELEMQNITI